MQGQGISNHVPDQIGKTHWLLGTHWGWVTHICISKLTIIISDNGLSPGWCQPIIWTKAEILFIWPSGRNFCEISIHAFSFKKMHLKKVAILSQPQCVKGIIQLMLHKCNASYPFMCQLCIIQNTDWIITRTADGLTPISNTFCW